MKIAFIFNKQRDNKTEEAEFDTPEVIDSITAGLSNNGQNEVFQIEMTKDGSWVGELKKVAPDLVFNTAEGFYGIGRECLAPINFDQLKIPYVGSGPYACFLTLDKFLTKQLVASKGIPTPDSYFISDKKELKIIVKDLQFPVFVKPNFEGSSKGISSRSKCENVEELLSYAEECLKEYPEGILVKRYIEGKDVVVPYIHGIGNNGILEAVEYSGPKYNGEWIYDYDLKNIFDEKVGVICPANIDEGSKKKITTYMRKIIQVLAINDFGRADFRITPTGDVFFIEFNALPSLQPRSGIFEATQLLNMDYTSTIQSIVSAAIKRLKLKTSRLTSARKIVKRDPRVALVFNLKRKTHSDYDYENEAEFDSENTVNAIKNAIEANGYETLLVEADRNLSQNLIEKEIDIVFNIAEGINKQAREAQVPAICDLLNIEHTGSDASCLALTLNKSITNRLMASEDVQVPRSKIIDLPVGKINHNLHFPVIVKPNMEGTSKGIYDSSVVDTDEQLTAKIHELAEKFKSPLLCEEYIEGRELTVGVVGDSNPKVLGILEIEFKKGRSKYPVYTFEAKQLENQLDNEVFKMCCPANIDRNLNKKITTFVKKAFKVAGCRDIARIDLRVSNEGEPYFIEINPLPGLSPGFSDLTIMAEKMGVKYEQLIGHIIKPAVRRWRKSMQKTNI